MSPAKNSLKEDDRPSLQFYVKDWLGDPGLRACSIAARGLWIDMISIMFTACHRGELTINGKRADSKTLAKIEGLPEAEIEALLEDLNEHGVYSTLPDGTIICRRMIKEAATSRARAEAGQKGAASRWQTDGKTAHGKMAKPWQTAEEEEAREEAEAVSLRGREGSREDGEGKFCAPIDPEDAILDKAIAEQKAEETIREAEHEKKRRKAS